MIRKALGLIAGMALAASVGAANAADPATKAGTPDILASLDGAAYQQLGEREMARTVGTQAPGASILSTLLSAVTISRSGSSFTITPSSSFWPVTVTRSGSTWTITPADSSQTLTATANGSSLTITSSASPEVVTITRSGSTYIASSNLSSQTVTRSGSLRSAGGFLTAVLSSAAR